MTDPQHDGPHEFTCFDAHSDLLYSVVRERATGRTNVVEQDFLPGMRAGGIALRVAAVYVDAEYVPEMALRRGLGIVEAFHREIEETPGLRAAETAVDVRRGATADADDVTLILGMEGAEPLVGDLPLLDVFYRLGLRLVTLTHSRRNAVGDGAPFEPRPSGTPGGLSPFGVGLVERMGELGMVVDVSHLNETGFWDVIEVADAPVIASHSNCRALKDHSRNLTDEQIAAVAETGGVVGVNALQVYLGDDDPDLARVLDHVEHAVEVAGVGHVGFGFDFYGYNLDYMSAAEREYMIDVAPAEGLADDAAVAGLAPALLDRGFDRDDAERILQGNFVRVFEDVLPAE